MFTIYTMKKILILGFCKHLDYYIKKFNEFEVHVFTNDLKNKYSIDISNENIEMSNVVIVFSEKIFNIVKDRIINSDIIKFIFFQNQSTNFLSHKNNIHVYKSISIQHITSVLIKNGLFKEQITTNRQLNNSQPSIAPNTAGLKPFSKMESIKQEYRTFCKNELQSICELELPIIQQNRLNEAVIVETRELEHFEIIVRNCIYKLGEEWSHTIICGKNNYNFISNMVSKINRDIKIIKLPKTTISQNDYNNMLLSIDFWNLCVGEKILIYQEDSFIFKHNIMDFINWDYIGAPFKFNCVDGINVGNGGLSLRSKSKMIQVLQNTLVDSFNVHQLKPFVRDFMARQRLDRVPEDIYFSTCLQKMHIGIVADFETAKQFSSETVYFEDSFGMHCMWHGCRDWKDKFKQLNYNNITINEIVSSEKVIADILLPSKYVSNGKVIIYILCFNEDRFNSAFDIYKQYTWAKPILMKNNTFEFENSFWEQLNEIENDWFMADMVGAMSYSAFKKVDLNKIDSIISNKIYYPNSYYHFFTIKRKIENCDTLNHPKFLSIWFNFLPKVNLFTSNEALFNYWMCKPILMKQFINWYITTCKPLLLNEPYIFSDAKYNPPNYSIDLIKLWGKPYFPHYPFICERLHHTYFVSKFKIVFLISHERSKTGAPIMLEDMQKIYNNYNIRTVFLYYPEIIKKNINIVEFITNQSIMCNCSPIVIVNTIACYPLINILKNTNILTYWYIHEWYEPPKYNNFFTNHLQLLNNCENESNVRLLFICNKQKELYKKYVSTLKDTVLISNKISKTVLSNQIQNSKNNLLETNTENKIVLSVIGTICERKNQQKFLDDVFYKLVDNSTCIIELNIVGKICENINLNDKYKNNVKLIGEVDNPILYINMSDIIVSYSLNEVCPLNIIESFYCKKPVVSSNVGGVSDIIDDNRNGFLFDANDATHCYKLLENLLKNKNLRDDIGKNAYLKYESDFNLDTNHEDYLFILGFN